MSVQVMIAAIPTTHIILRSLTPTKYPTVSIAYLLINGVFHVKIKVTDVLPPQKLGDLCI